MTKNTNLVEQLHNYGQSDFYPYHMPGHKRRQLGQIPQQLLNMDITEIDGFDNLHQPEGILRELQNQANGLYGASETFFLVNGSTCGILSALSAVLPEGGRLLMARGCHKSAYHAVYLRKLQVSYLYANRVDGFEFEDAITAEQIEQALEREPDVGAVFIVSPTYEGRIAEIEKIAQIVHQKGIPLIVDEAHGAHLGFAECFAQGSCSQGADIVIHSVHKTLPAMTQTALLHVNGELVDRERLKRFLHIYQSSSPSYVLMASISDAMQILQHHKTELFADFFQRYSRMYEQLKTCRKLQFIPFGDIETMRQDVGKLIISTAQTGYSGQWLYDTLRDKYHLQCEMAAGSYCLAMFTLADDCTGYERMAQALLELDELLTQGKDIGQQPIESLVSSPVIAYSLTEAWDMPRELTELSKAVNLTVADFINLYPPGIPILVPGEVLTPKLYDVLCDYQRKHLNIQGIIEQDGKYFVSTIIR